LDEPWAAIEADMKISSASSILSALKVIGLAVIMTFVLSAYAQQPASTPASPDDTNQQLLARINALEAKVKQLEEKEAAPGPP
jgi:hypothetical protein